MCSETNVAQQTCKIVNSVCYFSVVLLGHVACIVEKQTDKKQEMPEHGVMNTDPKVLGNGKARLASKIIIYKFITSDVMTLCIIFVLHRSNILSNNNGQSSTWHKWMHTFPILKYECSLKQVNCQDFSSYNSGIKKKIEIQHSARGCTEVVPLLEIIRG